MATSLLADSLRRARTRPAAAVSRPPALDEYLEIDTSGLDLGVAWSVPDRRIALPVRNACQQTVHVGVVGTSCNCVTVAPSTLALPPGGQGRLDLKLDLMDDFDGPFGPPRHYEAEVLVELTQPVRRRQSLRIRGFVRDAVRLHPARIHLGDTLILGGEAIERAVRVRCGPEVADVGLAIERRDASADGSEPPSADAVARAPIGTTPHAAVEATAELGGLAISALLTLDEQRPTECSYTLNLRIRATAADVQEPAAVVLLPRADDGRLLARVRVPIQGRVQQDVLFLPPVVLFGPLRVGQASAQFVTLSTRSGRALRILNVNPPEGMTAAATGPGIYRLEQTAREEGSHTRELRFSVAIEGLLDPVSVIVPCSYTGLSTESNARQENR